LVIIFVIALSQFNLSSSVDSVFLIKSDTPTPSLFRKVCCLEPRMLFTKVSSPFSNSERFFDDGVSLTNFDSLPSLSVLTFTQLRRLALSTHRHVLKYMGLLTPSTITSCKSE